MKKRLLFGFIIAAMAIVSCSKEDAGNAPSKDDAVVSSEANENASNDAKESTDSETAGSTAGDAIDASAEVHNTDGIFAGEIDYAKDYTEDFKTAVENATQKAECLNDELTAIEQIEEQISDLETGAETQAEMNVTSYLHYQLWDAELNSLWGRLDEAKKQELLPSQRTWNAIREDAVIESLGPAEEGGSIYPTLENCFLRDATKRRCQILASELAKATGDDFVREGLGTECSYIDTQDSEDLCGAISINEGWESGYRGKITIFRTCSIEGTVETVSDELLTFVSDDESIKGNIKYGWDGAEFEVTEAPADSEIKAGNTYSFPFVY